jgi:precorrin-6B methylase 2
VATVEDAIELLRDRRNLRDLGGGSTAGLGVDERRVIAELRFLGVESPQEARALIRQAARALGGDEVIVRRPGALGVDKFGSRPERPETAFWVPGPKRHRPGW